MLVRVIVGNSLPCPHRLLCQVPRVKPPNERMDILPTFTQNLSPTCWLNGKLYIMKMQLLVVVNVPHNSTVLSNGKAVFVKVAVDLDAVSIS
jgi:hypothetical protein